MTSAKILVVIIMIIYGESMGQVFLKQTVERRGSSVFCVGKSFEVSPHSGERGRLDGFAGRGGDASPLNMCRAERERR